MRTLQVWLSQSWRIRVGGYVILLLGSSLGVLVMITDLHLVGTLHNPTTTPNDQIDVEHLAAGRQVRSLFEEAFKRGNMLFNMVISARAGVVPTSARANDSPACPERICARLGNGPRMSWHVPLVPMPRVAVPATTSPVKLGRERLSAIRCEIPCTRRTRGPSSNAMPRISLAWEPCNVLPKR